MRTFNYQGNLIKNARNAIGISQDSFAKILGYKNGQMVSNLERGFCGLPGKKIKEASKLLNISEEEIIDSMVKDFKINVLR